MRRDDEGAGVGLVRFIKQRLVARFIWSADFFATFFFKSFILIAGFGLND